MKNKLTYLFLFVLLTHGIFAQEIQLPISQAGSCLYKGYIYSYGLQSRKQAVFCVYRFDLQLKLKDSLIVPLPKTKADGYLQLSADTLHNYLSIYLQQKEKMQVTVFRFNKNFELLATIENVEVARLNNTALFTSETFYYKDNAYTLKVQNDTSGKQFYLNKYVLESAAKNFDYGLKWQFPFERKEIRSAHIFYADQKEVLMQVHVSGGKKIGQWLLKVNAETGELIRGTKLNARNDPSVYLLGQALVDTANKITRVLGEKLSEAQFNEKDNKLNIANRTSANIYLIELDSAGDVVSRQDFKIPAGIVSSGAKKTSNTFVLRIASLKKNNDNSLSFEADVYGNSNSSFCYNYQNTILFNLIQGDENLVLEKNAISINPSIEKFYATNDKLDMNGKLCADSVLQFEKVVYKSIVLPVKQDFKYSDNNSSWLLTKSNAKKNTITYALLQPVKKIYQLTTLEEIAKSENPLMIPLSDRWLLIAKQSSENSYRLKLFSW